MNTNTTLQIDSTSHNQVWDRIYFFDQFGFGRVLKSTKNPNNDPYDSRTSKEAKRREIQLKFEKVSQYFPSKLLETIPNPLYRVDLVIYGWIRWDLPLISANPFVISSVHLWIEFIPLSFRIEMDFSLKTTFRPATTGLDIPIKCIQKPNHLSWTSNRPKHERRVRIRAAINVLVFIFNFFD